MVVLMLIKR